MLEKQEKLSLIGKMARLSSSEKEMELFLDDILTLSEINQIYERIQVVSLLMDKVPQRKISEQTGVGIATVTRGAALFQKPTFILSKFIQKARQLPWWR